MPEEKNSTWTWVLLAIFGIVGIGALIYFMMPRVKGEEYEEGEEAPAPPTPPAEGKCNLAVYVYEAGTVVETPIEGALVKIEKVDGGIGVTFYSGYTNYLGCYEFKNIDAGKWNITVEKNGYYTTRTDITTEPNKNYTKVVKIQRVGYNTGVGYEIDYIPDPSKYYTTIEFVIEAEGRTPRERLITNIDQKKKMFSYPILPTDKTLCIINLDDNLRPLKELTRVTLSHEGFTIALLKVADLVKRKPIE